MPSTSTDLRNNLPLQQALVCVAAGATIVLIGWYAYTLPSTPNSGSGGLHRSNAISQRRRRENANVAEIESALFDETARAYMNSDGRMPHSPRSQAHVESYMTDADTDGSNANMSPAIEDEGPGQE
ncbi:hypothetical protein LTR66_005933 [Elasticomyces elasticus]|nr:hypothetical protein LTR66_005933 [Elasticomyces elasticus]